MATPKKSKTTTLEEATQDRPKPPEAPPLDDSRAEGAGEYVRENRARAAATEGAQAEAPAPAASSGSGTPLPSLPTEKVRSGGSLEEKTTVLFGPAGIGKSTMASEWADGDVFFFDCAGELNDLEVFKSGTDDNPPITDWHTFRAYCASIKANPGMFKGGVIDTADMCGLYCAQAVRKRLGIVHESDADWGKGWSAVREEFQSHMAKLAAIPNFGLILVSHSKEVEIKTRSATWNKAIPTLTGGVRDACVNMADLVLFIDWADDEHENRVIRTKPSRYWEAKERGQMPRLPAEIPWPLGESGYRILKEAWDAAS